jgi:hypothetical protein
MPSKEQNYGQARCTHQPQADRVVMSQVTGTVIEHTEDVIQHQAGAQQWQQ